MSNDELNRSDKLALVRTKLANERTFLAYFRTFVVFLSSGFAILKLDILMNIKILGYFFIVIAFVVLSVGFLRFVHIKNKIHEYYK